MENVVKLQSLTSNIKLTFTVCESKIFYIEKIIEFYGTFTQATCISTIAYYAAENSNTYVYAYIPTFSTKYGKISKNMKKIDENTKANLTTFHFFLVSSKESHAEKSFPIQF